ncbi:MAG TPA: 9-O-acetylesterase [Lentisphaeria bacterium]|nr:9-O-acetylesterase [Lentisphaeria bacterium]
MRKSLLGILFGAALLALNCLAAEEAAAPAELKVHTMFSNNMVLQRGIPVKIWGVAKPGSEVTVKFASQEKKAKADDKGNWMATLDTMKENSTPAVLEVSSEIENRKSKFENVLVGDVWICSGQSNMEFVVNSSINSQQEIAEAKYPEIRLFTVAKKPVGEPIKTLNGEWKVCAPETVGNFSAVGYFFGRDLNKDLKIPIGLINTSWGGTPAETWTTFKTLESDPDFSAMIERYKAALSSDAMENYKKALADWEKEKGSRKEDDRIKDPGNKGFEQGWAKSDFNDSDWKTMKLPCMWESQGMNIDGAVWFRKNVEIPEKLAGKDLTITLGSIDDFDVTYFNGTQIGTTGEDTPNFWSFPRKYTIPANLVKSGKNCLAVRAFDHFGGGGFGGQAKDMRIILGEENVDISGEWKYKVEYSVVSSMRPQAPMGPNNPNAPATLFNGMINPVIPYTIKGAIWYQGCSNAGRAYQYRKLLPAMINDWRKEWAQPEPGKDFPFFIVQLANFMAPATKPEDSAWAELREAQAMTASGLKNCGLALAIDIGDAKDIHPKNKQDVGKRLELAALKVAYGKDIVFSGPTYDSMKVDGDKIVLSFKNVGGGLIAKDGDLKHFSIAGDDKAFVWAKAKIDGDKIIVSSDDMKKPVAVRYAWANNPEGCNLYNKEGLPAVPFRTDTWDGVTINNR